MDPINPTHKIMSIESVDQQILDVLFTRQDKVVPCPHKPLFTLMVDPEEVSHSFTLLLNLRRPACPAPKPSFGTRYQQNSSKDPLTTAAARYYCSFYDRVRQWHCAVYAFLCTRIPSTPNLPSTDDPDRTAVPSTVPNTFCSPVRIVKAIDAEDFPATPTPQRLLICPLPPLHSLTPTRPHKLTDENLLLHAQSFQQARLGKRSCTFEEIVSTPETDEKEFTLGEIRWQD
ncbi:hypothetical protein PM082_024220 [Marasmius tenuissimus]|nr:hypothetical protein PM082_024220 [Marasmius tenuissimus]